MVTPASGIVVLNLLLLIEWYLKKKQEIKLQVEIVEHDRHDTLQYRSSNNCF